MGATVYFSPVITPEKVLDMFRLVDKTLPGNIAIKLHSGEKGNQNFLGPEFWKQYKSLPYSTTNREGYREYKSLSYQCENCPTRNICTESRSCQKVVTRHIWADYIEQAEDIRHSYVEEKFIVYTS